MQTLTNQQIKNKIINYKQKKIVKGLKALNNDINYFHKHLKKIGKALQIINNPRIVAVDNQHKIIYVDQSFQKGNVGQQYQDKFSIISTQIQLNYKNFQNQIIFNWFTKEQEGQIPFPNSFETVGHMAHYNLTPQQQKYKKVIGQITLLKCPNIKTVVNKTQKLHNVYRTPTLQHMSGQKNYYVKVKQQGVSFELDFEKVYWCSRLQQERDRLLSIMQPKQLLADIFCGVGPLAVRAAKKGLYVIANDLNPFCYEYLQNNCKINRIQNKVMCWNMCAREAMRKIYKQKQTYPLQFQEPDHIYMNLPVDAIQFLDVLSNYSMHMKTNKMPLVHVNCFVVADSQEKSRQLLSIRIKKVLPQFEEEDIKYFHHIKNVTVIMRMYCVSIKLRSQQKKPQNKNQQQQPQVQVENMRKKIKQ